jgi:hydrogenase maturation protease
MTTTNKIKIIGIGSPFGLDQIGKIMIDKLQAELPQQENVELVYLDRPGYYLLEHIRDSKTVHLIDAIQSDKPLGYIHRYEYPNIDFKSQQLISSHACDLKQVLQLAEALGYSPKKLIIHGVEIGSEDKICLDNFTITSACEKLTSAIIKKYNNI